MSRLCVSVFFIKSNWKPTWIDSLFLIPIRDTADGPSWSVYCSHPRGFLPIKETAAGTDRDQWRQVLPRQPVIDVRQHPAPPVTLYLLLFPTRTASVNDLRWISGTNVDFYVGPLKKKWFSVREASSVPFTKRQVIPWTLVKGVKHRHLLDAQLHIPLLVNL